MTVRLLLIAGTIGLLCSSCSRTTLGFFVKPENEKPAPATFSFELDENNCDEVVWDFGDGTMSTDTSPNHTYFLSGNYVVTLKGKRGKKTKEIQKEILVKAPDKCLVRIETPYGTMIAELYENTPKHRDNFVKLSDEGFFNDLLFHRVINGFMIQGGDPGSRGADMSVPLGGGGPGYQIDAEMRPEYAHIKGALAAARTGDQVNPMRKSSGSQFYIVQGKAVSENNLKQIEARHGETYSEETILQYEEVGGVPFLDQQYTVFGQVIEGLDVIDQIAAVQTNGSDRPLENITMKITLIK